MYATLAAGTVRRSLTTADLNVPDGDTTGACGLHAGGPGPNPAIASVGAVPLDESAPPVLTPADPSPTTGAPAPSPDVLTAALGNFDGATPFDADHTSSGALLWSSAAEHPTAVDRLFAPADQAGLSEPFDPQCWAS